MISAIFQGYCVPFRQRIPTVFSWEKAARCWMWCKELFYAPSELSQKVRIFAQSSDLQTEAQKQIVVEALCSKEYPQLIPFLRQGLESAQDQEVHATFEQLFSSQVDKDPEILVRRLQEFMTLAKIEAVVRSKFLYFTSTLEVTGNISKEEAEEYGKRMLATRNTLKQILAVYCINSFDYIVNILMYVFHAKPQNIATGSQGETQYLAESQYRAFRENLVLISGWVVALSLYTQSLWMTALITAASLISVVTIIYSYLKWFKPCPDKLPCSINLVTQAKMGELSPVYGRDREIEAVINALCSNDTTSRRHPLLLGETGAGKTEIVKGLALRIAQGNVPEALKGKKVFWINTADLSSYTYGTSNLDMLKSAVAGYEADAIFFFDEVQSAFNKKKVEKTPKRLGQQLKTLMDPGQTNFKYIIAATTSQEYEDYIQDSAFIRRICPIKVESASDETTLAILSEMVRSQAPEIAVEQEALQALSQLGADLGPVSQPAKSITLLAQAIASVRTPQLPKKREALQKLKNQRDTLRSMRKTSFGPLSSVFSAEGLKHFQKLQEVEGEIRIIEKEILDLENQIAQFQAVVRKRSKLKESTTLLAIQIAKGVCTEDSAKTFLLSYHFLLNALASWIEKKKETFPIPVALNRHLAQEIIAQEKEKSNAIAHVRT